jgi:hypothetical protein
MAKDNEKKETAADIVFETVYQVSEDMIGLVHKLVSDNATYERAFLNMAKKLEEIHSNLKKFVFSKKWLSKDGKKKVQTKMEQTRELSRVAIEFSKKCRVIADELIFLTQKIESNKKLTGVLDILVERLEKADQEDQEEEDSESPGED